MQTATYALITGASQGLGKALAIECATKKWNLILVALPGSNIAEVAAEITKEYGIDCYAFEKDLSNEEACVALYNEVNSLNIEVSVLINNAGLIGTHLFEEQPYTYHHQMIKVNIAAPVILTNLFIPLLEKNTRSYILNIGSLSSYFYLPMKQVYGASKSFLFSFSLSIRKELASKNISVSIICPGGINSNSVSIQNNKTGSWIARTSIMDAKDVARVAIEGMLKGKSVILPGKLNRLFLGLDKVLPAFVKNKVTASHMKKLKKSHEQASTIANAEVTELKVV